MFIYSLNLVENDSSVCPMYFLGNRGIQIGIWRLGFLYVLVFRLSGFPVVLLVLKYMFILILFNC